MGRYRLPPGSKHKRDAAEDSSSGWWIILPVLIVAVAMCVVMITVMNSSQQPSRRYIRQPRLPASAAVEPPVDQLSTAAPPAQVARDALDFSKPPPREFYTAAVGRSPLPDYDENINRPIAPTRLDHKIVSSAPPLKPGQILLWHQAPQYVGRIATIEGEVLLARNTGKVCFLNFVKQWRGRFYIILFDDVLNSWPQPPEKYFLNKSIRVTGEIRTHDTVPQIQVRDSSQITVVEN